jgi:hypothetical protein
VDFGIGDANIGTKWRSKFSLRRPIGSVVISGSRRPHHRQDAGADRLGQLFPCIHALGKFGVAPTVAFALGLALQGRYTTPAEAARRAGIGKISLFRWPRLGQMGDKRFAPLVARVKAIQENCWSLWS